MNRKTITLLILLMCISSLSYPESVGFEYIGLKLNASASELKEMYPYSMAFDFYQKKSVNVLPSELRGGVYIIRFEFDENGKVSYLRFDFEKPNYYENDSRFPECLEITNQLEKKYGKPEWENEEFDERIHFIKEWYSGNQVLRLQCNKIDEKGGYFATGIEIKQY